MSSRPSVKLQETVVSNTDLIVKNTGQSELNTLPSSGGVRCGDMRHHDVLLCSVIDINGQGTLYRLVFLPLGECASLGQCTSSR